MMGKWNRSALDELGAQMAIRKVILTIAPTGGIVTKEQNPKLPTQPDEIAADVVACWRAGAAVAALHARRPDHQATCDPEIYRKINDSIRARSDIIINNSTGGGPDGDMVRPIAGDRIEVDFEERIKGTEAGAEMCTFDPQTMSQRIRSSTVLFETSFERCIRLAEAMADAGIKPEWEVYGPADFVFVQRLIDMGYDKAPHYVNIVLGTDGAFSGTWPYKPRYLQIMVDELPSDSFFGVTAIGAAQLPATLHGVLLGGHMRVGLEDNIYFRRGELATNLQLVERAVRLIRELDMEPATPEEARQMLGLSPIKDGPSSPEMGPDGNSTRGGEI
jgi:uncharacterized protein (DUF849 family)